MRACKLKPSTAARLAATLLVVCAVALGLSALSPVAGWAGMSFQRSDVPVGNMPSAVVSGNLDADETSDDLVVANRGSDTVSVLLGQDNGTLLQASGSPISVGDQPVDVDLADLDAQVGGGGGQLDLVVLNAGNGTGNGTLSVFLGHGDGTFTAAPASPYTVGGDPSAVAAFWESGGGGTFDINDDGHPDIVVANRADDTVTVLFGDGDGTFDGQPPAVLPSMGDAPTDVEVGLTWPTAGILTANSGSGTLGVLYNDGTGNFPVGQRTTFAVGDSPTAIGFVSDRLPGVSKDFLAVARAGADDVQMRESVSPFAELPGSAFAVGDQPVALGSGAFSGNGPDGQLEDPMAGWPVDVVVADRGSDELSFLLGDTLGGFTRAVGTFGTGDQPVSVAGFLLSGDSRQDVAVANFASDTVTVLRNTSVSQLTPAPASDSFGEQATATIGAAHAVTLTNTGGRPLDLRNVSLAGENPGDFVISSDGCSAMRLPGAIDASCTVLVRFAPQSIGARGAQLLIRDTAPGGPHQVPLSGVGVMPPAGPQGATGATGATGAIGAIGPIGPIGPVGLAGRDGRLVLVAYKATASRLKVTVRYALTGPAAITLKVKPPKGSTVTVAKTKGRAGINTVSWNRKIKGTKARKGTYKLTITAKAGDRSSSSSITVRLR